MGQGQTVIYVGKIHDIPLRTMDGDQFIVDFDVKDKTK